jgi:hypothetical protein
MIREKYLGTISISRSLTAHLQDSHYRLVQGATFSDLIYDEVLFTINRLPSLLSVDHARHISVGKFLIEHKEMKALWNTMLSYLRLMGKDTTPFESQLTLNQDYIWQRQEGKMPELAEPLEGDDL